MNKRQTRLFAIGATALSALAFLALTIDSHRQFDRLTNAAAITPAVAHGKDVWHKYNCVNCHTLFGEGDAADALYNVTAGTVKLYKLLPDGRRQILGFLFPGDFVGLALDPT